MGASHSRENKAPVSHRFSLTENHLLRATYKELASLSKSHKTIDKATFLRFVPLPGMYGERLFKVFDDKHTGYIDYEEFMSGLSVWCKGSSKEKIEFIFRLYDLNCDNTVSREELQTMLMNIPPYALKILGSHLDAPVIAQLVEAGLAANHESHMDMRAGHSVESSSVFFRPVSSTASGAYTAPVPHTADASRVEPFPVPVSQSCQSSIAATETVTNTDDVSTEATPAGLSVVRSAPDECKNRALYATQSSEKPTENCIPRSLAAVSTASSMERGSNMSEHSHSVDIPVHALVPQSAEASGTPLSPELVPEEPALSPEFIPEEPTLSPDFVPEEPILPCAPLPLFDMDIPPSRRSLCHSLSELVEEQGIAMDDLAMDDSVHHVGVEFSLDMLDDADWTDSMSKLVVDELVNLAFRGFESDPAASLTLDQFVHWIELMPEMVEFLESMFPTIHTEDSPQGGTVKTANSGKIKSNKSKSGRMTRSFSTSSNLSHKISSVYSSVLSRNNHTAMNGSESRSCSCHISRSAAAIAAINSRKCTFGTCKSMSRFKTPTNSLQSAPGSTAGAEFSRSHSITHISSAFATRDNPLVRSMSAATPPPRDHSSSGPSENPYESAASHIANADDIVAGLERSSKTSNAHEPTVLEEDETGASDDEGDEGKECAGILYKKGKRSHVLVARWCVLGVNDQFLYYYHKAKDREPSGVIYLEGSFVEPVGGSSAPQGPSSPAKSLSRSRTTSPPPCLPAGAVGPGKDGLGKLALTRSSTVATPGDRSRREARLSWRSRSRSRAKGIRSNSPPANPRRSSEGHHLLLPHMPLHVPHALHRAHYGIRVTPAGNGEARVLYASSAEDRDRWLTALKKATKVREFSEYFEIGEQIGSGRFSKVYMCRSLRRREDDEDVDKRSLIGRSPMHEYRFAVKVIEKSEIRESEKELMRNEIAILRLVNQPNVVRTLDVFESIQHIYIVMDRMIGGELYHRVVGRKCLSELEAFKVVKGLVTGISYLHSMGIVHRDIKPENILCGEDLADIKIADFGLSKLAGPQEVLLLPCGTLSYVAPEVLITGRKAAEAEAQQHHLALSAPLGSGPGTHAAALAAAEHALKQSLAPLSHAGGRTQESKEEEAEGYGKEADLWSVGVILYLLVAGRLPFNGRTRNHTIDLICGLDLRFDVPPFGKLSEELRGLLAGLLCKDPKARLDARAVLVHPWMLRMERTQLEMEGVRVTKGSTAGQ